MKRKKTNKKDSSGIMLYTGDIILTDDYICYIKESIIFKSGFALYSPENDHYSDLYMYDTFILDNDNNKVIYKVPTSSDKQKEIKTYKFIIKKKGRIKNEEEFISNFETEEKWNKLRKKLKISPTKRQYKPTK